METVVDELSSDIGVVVVVAVVVVAAAVVRSV